MRSLSILLGYSLLAAGLYWESSSKPVLDDTIAVTGKTVPVKSKPLPRAVAVNHLVAHDKTSTTVDHLTNGAWKMRSVTSNKPCDTNGDGYETTDIFSEMSPCAKDDVLFVRKNGRAVYQRGLACGEESATESYAWTLSEDGLFTLSAGSIRAEMYLVSADANTLKMVIPMEEAGKEYRFTVTYSH